MTPEQALDFMRLTPEKAFTECAFSVTSPKAPKQEPLKPLYADIPDCGGPAGVTVNRLTPAADSNMFDIFIKEMIPYQTGGKRIIFPNYYYPYINTIPTKVGFCFVPVDCPPGTVVFTDGMNGCALQVNRTADSRNLIFMHDSDGVSITKNSNALAQRINLAYTRHPDYQQVDAVTENDLLHGGICRVDYKGYADLKETDGDFIKKYGYFSYYLVTIKRPGRWEVYLNCILTTVDTDTTEHIFRRGTDESVYGARCIRLFS